MIAIPVIAAVSVIITFIAKKLKKPTVKQSHSKEGIEFVSAYDFYNEIEKEVKSQLPIDTECPIKDIDKEKWDKFLDLTRRGLTTSVSPNYRLGVFQFSMLQLSDLGLCKNPKRGDYNGRNVWQADWVEPNSLKSFLSNPKLQYEQYCRLMKAYYEIIKEKYGEFIDKEFEGQKITPSGLLAIAKHSSLGGLEKWLKEENTRKESTTAVFRMANGVF